MKRTAFFISDGTGITAEALGRSLLTQFESIEFEFHTIPYVNTLTKARQIRDQIELDYTESKTKPLVFATIVNPDISNILHASNCMFIDFFSTFLDPLKKELGRKPEKAVGKFHSAKNRDTYALRIDAINYSLTSDDGSNLKDYSTADIILIGVSRSGKTPTSLYLALQFGIFAANYPLTEEDFVHRSLPEVLKPYKNKLFGLVIDPARLHQIREARLANSKYSSLEQCRSEINQIKDLLQKESILYLDTTKRSIEELAAEIMVKMHLQRKI